MNMLTQKQPPTQLANTAPIGLFDSGVGGLSIYLHLAEQLPNERYIYYADTRHVPYGTRDGQQICELTLIAVEWLYQQGCKLIVIACNSASAHALDTVRQRYPQLSIVGLVPALKPAVLASKSKHVVVLATQATLNGKLLNRVIDEVAIPTGTKVSKHFEPLLVPWVEAGMPMNTTTANMVKEYLHTFCQQGADHLVLGCTHYPFFRSYLEQEIHHHQLNMHIVDSGQAIASRVYYLLAQQGLLAPQIPHYTDSNKEQNNAQQIILTTTNSTQTTTNHPTIHQPNAYPLVFFASQTHQKLADLVQCLVKQPVIMIN